MIPTIASVDLLGAAPPDGISGVTLTPLMTGTPELGLDAYSEAMYPLHHYGWSDLRALRSGRYKVVDAPRPELYDLEKDPAEVRNLFAERRTEAAPLQSALSALERATSAAAHRPQTDPLLAERFMSLGYVGYSPAVRSQLKQWEEMGFGKLPVCIAKTQYSFSTNPDAKGAPTGFNIPVREVRLSAGAEFIVAICGEIMTMPGLPRVPAADSIDVGSDGKIVGLF